MNRFRASLVAFVLSASAAAGCRTGQPVIGADRDPTTPGTIAGIVSAPGGEPLSGRRVQAVGAASAHRYSAVTSVTGGFSIPVPPGDYRLEVELREGERVLRQPSVIHINKSDLDANLKVVVGP
jgi:hypothetical protein